MPKVACGLSTGVLAEDGGRQRSPCGDENHAGVCGPVCLVGRCVSPVNLHQICDQYWRPRRDRNQARCIRFRLPEVNATKSHIWYIHGPGVHNISILVRW